MTDGELSWALLEIGYSISPIVVGTWSYKKRRKIGGWAKEVLHASVRSGPRRRVPITLQLFRRMDRGQRFSLQIPGLDGKAHERPPRANEATGTGSGDGVPKYRLVAAESYPSWRKVNAESKQVSSYFKT